MLRLSSRLASLANLLITTSFTRPKGKRAGRIGAGLINGPIRRDDLSAATRTKTPARGALLDVECQGIVIVSHFLETVSTR